MNAYDDDLLRRYAGAREQVRHLRELRDRLFHDSRTETDVLDRITRNLRDAEIDAGRLQALIQRV